MMELRAAAYAKILQTRSFVPEECRDNCLLMYRHVARTGVVSTKFRNGGSVKGSARPAHVVPQAAVMTL
jgi:hypothetical protein